MITNPKKAIYNAIYRRTTFGIEDMGKGIAKRQSHDVATSVANVSSVAMGSSGKKVLWTVIIGTVLLIALGWGMLFLPFFYTGMAIYWICHPEYKRKEAIKMSDKLYAKGQKQESIDVLLPFAGEQNYEVFKRLGYRYSATGQYEKAEPYQRYAIEHNPTDLENLYAYSVTLFNLKKYDESLSILSTLPDYVQKEAIFANIIGANYNSTGKEDVAIEIYKKCVSRKQNLAGEEISIAINLVKILLGKNNKEEARKYLLKVLAVSPTHAQAIELLAKT